MRTLRLTALIAGLAVAGAGVLAAGGQKPVTGGQGGSGGRGQGQPAEPERVSAAKWEYRVLKRNELLGLGKNDLAAGLNRVGAEGWELVAVEPAGRAEGRRASEPAQFYFKRRTSKTGPAATPVARAEIQVIPLKNANAQEVAKVLQTMFRDNEAVVIAAEQQTNQIVVRASPADLQEIKVVTSRLDLASESAPVARAETHMITLKFVKAPEVAKILQTVFQGRDGMVIATDDRTNQVVIRATPVDLQEIKTIIDRLDVPAEKKK